MKNKQKMLFNIGVDATIHIEKCFLSTEEFITDYYDVFENHIMDELTTVLHREYPSIYKYLEMVDLDIIDIGHNICGEDSYYEFYTNIVMGFISTITQKDINKFKLLCPIELSKTNIY